MQVSDFMYEKESFPYVRQTILKLGLSDGLLFYSVLELDLIEI